MTSPLTGLLDRIRPKLYGRRQPLILLNGLAEQAESWYRNRRFWGRYFDLYAPNILAYEGDALHQRIEAKLAIDLDYLVGQLHTYLSQFVQAPPYHLVASSLGGKVAVEFAARYPDMVNRMVLICPSGMGDAERLPIMAGIKGRDPHAMVQSVFFNPLVADGELLRYYQAKFPNRKWKVGFVKTVRGTLDHTVRDKLKAVKCPTLLVTGANDQICCPKTAEAAARDLPAGHFLKLPRCGHAPQIERHRLINRLVVHYLSAPQPSARPSWPKLLLVKPTRVPAK